jgi:hypothetical protein
MWRAGRKASVGEERKVYKVLWEGPRKRNHSENRSADGRMELEWILKRLAGGVMWREFAWLRIGTVDLVNEVMNLQVLEPRS